MEKKKIPTLKTANKGKENKRICLLAFSFFELLTLSDLSWVTSPCRVTRLIGDFQLLPR